MYLELIEIIRLTFWIDAKIIVRRKMSERHRAVRCRCRNAIYSGGYAKSDSDSDDAPDARGSSARMQNADAKMSLSDSTRIESSKLISREPSQRSIAVEVLRKVDSDRMSRINMQNLKLSLLFPQASSLMSLTIPSFFFFYVKERTTLLIYLKT